MHVVAAIPAYPPGSLVGAWITTHAFLRAMVADGHAVTVHAKIAGRGYELDGVQVLPRLESARAWGDAMRSADVVVSHLGDNLAAAYAARTYHVPAVRMAHGGTVALGALAGDPLVVFNSHAYRAEVLELTGYAGPSIVCHPPVDPAEYRTTPGEHITLVNLSRSKGVLTFWRCAELLPAHAFLGVRGHTGEQVKPRARNVETVPPTARMRSIYERTRVLLMPSETETWGRVAVEAMCSGIPVIAHPSPGALEALGSAGVFVDRADVEGWCSAIEQLDDPAEYAAASQLALDRSAELAAGDDVARFVAAVTELAEVGA